MAVLFCLCYLLSNLQTPAKFISVARKVNIVVIGVRLTLFSVLTMSVRRVHPAKQAMGVGVMVKPVVNFCGQLRIVVQWRLVPVIPFRVVGLV